MQWEHEYSIGIKELDDQHRELQIYFSAIEQAVQLERPRSEIHQNLSSLLTFIQFHFAFEEAIMRLFGYPDCSAHTTEHEDFFNALAKVDSHPADVLRREHVIEHLARILIEHIDVGDRRYAEYVLSGAQVVKSPAAIA